MCVLNNYSPLTQSAKRSILNLIKACLLFYDMATLLSFLNVCIFFSFLKKHITKKKKAHITDTGNLCKEVFSLLKSSVFL